MNAITTDAQKEAKTLAGKIAEYCKPQKIVLFGSVVRGDGNKNSDIDLLVIKRSKQIRPFRVKEVFEAIRGIKRTFPLDVIVYTPEELKKRTMMGDYFINRVLEEGKVLYG